jgi:hypothetical protein
MPRRNDQRGLSPDANRAHREDLSDQAWSGTRRRGHGPPRATAAPPKDSAWRMTASPCRPVVDEVLHRLDVVLLELVPRRADLVALLLGQAPVVRQLLDPSLDVGAGCAACWRAEPASRRRANRSPPSVRYRAARRFARRPSCSPSRRGTSVQPTGAPFPEAAHVRHHRQPDRGRVGSSKAAGSCPVTVSSPLRCISATSNLICKAREPATSWAGLLLVVAKLLLLGEEGLVVEERIRQPRCPCARPSSRPWSP